MDVQIAVEKLIAEVHAYAEGRASDVARGLEPPRLSALLLQKYGYGVSAAAVALFGAPAAGPISKAVDNAVANIDPDWRAHAEARWSQRPADLG